jgi:hypothetical protein
LNRRIVMTASAVVMAVAGAAASFAPREILVAAGTQSPDAALQLLVQLAGALYLSFAIANWTARNSLIGGIYGRPLALANVLHFTMGSLALISHAGGGVRGVTALAVIYALFAIAFAVVFFTSPVSPSADRDGEAGTR